MKKIKDLNAGDSFRGNILLKTSTLKTTSKGSFYLDMVFADCSAQIPAKLWAVSDLMAKNPPNGGTIVYAEFSVEEYNDSLQARATVVQTIEDISEIDLSEIVPVAPADPKVMYHFIMDVVSKELKEDYKNVVTAAYEENKKKIFSLPAAKSVHHDFLGGLLYHTSKMLQTAVSLSRIYKEIDKELLFTGVILHDIAKIQEFSTSEIGLVEEYSTEGNLLGHITMGVTYVAGLCQKFGVSKERTTLLLHMILAHHGEPEMGSPIKPKILEAKILNLCDQIDADVQIFSKATANIEPGTFSERVFALGTSVYKPKNTEKS